VAKYKIGDVIDGTVTKLVNFGAFVRVEEGLEGLIHISELSHQRVAHPATWSRRARRSSSGSSASTRSAIASG
jgi:ribosomal protein S1